MNKLDDLKQQLDSIQKQIKELENPEFKVGDWVWFEGNLYKIKGAPDRCYVPLYPDNTYKWDRYEIDSWFDKEKRHATKEEIEAHLIKEAEKRGFRPGVIINRDFTYDYVAYGKATLRKEHKGQRTYNFEDDAFEYCGAFVYYDGKWATIIDDKITIDKYEVKFVDYNPNMFWVDKKQYFKHEIKTVLELDNFKALIMHDCSGKEIRVEKSKIEQIYERMK